MCNDYSLGFSSGTVIGAGPLGFTGVGSGASSGGSRAGAGPFGDTGFWVLMHSTPVIGFYSLRMARQQIETTVRTNSRL